jgi:squalene-hopene/tetraprenyl-beta-curcumene cyclase
MPTGAENNTQSDRRAELDRVEEVARKACEHLLGLQNEEGYWVGELEADASVAAGYIPLMLFMTGKVDESRARKAVHYVLSRQKPDGSWSVYEGAGDLGVGVRSIALAGRKPKPNQKCACKEFILSGGVQRANIITKICWLF